MTLFFKGTDFVTQIYFVSEAVVVFLDNGQLSDLVSRIYYLETFHKEVVSK